MDSRQAVILYAKHWFKETDLYEDLAKLWKISYGYDCSKRDVAELTLMMANDLIKHDQGRRLFMEFVNDIHKNQHWKFGRKNESGNFDDHWYGVIAKTLSMISVSDSKTLEQLFGPLCAPDYSVLERSADVSDEVLEQIWGKYAERG